MFECLFDGRLLDEREEQIYTIEVLSFKTTLHAKRFALVIRNSFESWSTKMETC